MDLQKLSRRAYLKGAGKLALALPLGDFLARSGKIFAAEPTAAPRRLVTFSFSNGCDPRLWNYDLALAPLKELRGKITVLSGLANPAAQVVHNVRDDGHQKGACTMFVGCPEAPDTLERAGGPSLDQLAYKTLKPGTQMAPLVVGLWRDVGEFPYSTTWRRRSWLETGVSVEPYVNPRDIFHAIFGQSTTGVFEDKFRGSMLDGLVEAYRSVRSDRYGLSPQSKARLDEHIEAVRELEKRVAQATPSQCEVTALPRNTPGSGNAIPFSEWNDVFKLQADLVIMALKCDTTRFSSIMFGSAAEKFFIPDMTLDEHSASHSPDTWFAGDFLEYRRAHMTRLAYLLQGMDQVIEADGKTLLESSVVVASTEFGESNTHAINPQPHLVAGGAGFIKTGQSIDVQGQHTTNDLYVSCLRAVGVETSTFGTAEYNKGVIAGLHV